MHTVTKKELVDRIAEQVGQKRIVVKKIIQGFLDQIIKELGRGNRLEFRDFGVYETKEPVEFPGGQPFGGPRESLRTRKPCNACTSHPSGR